MPRVLILTVASKTSEKVGNTIGAKQKAWSQAIQKRIAMTSSMLGSIKALKMMGLSDIIEEKVQKQRLEEIAIAADFRWMMVSKYCQNS